MSVGDPSRNGRPFRMSPSSGEASGGAVGEPRLFHDRGIRLEQSQTTSHKEDRIPSFVDARYRSRQRKGHLRTLPKELYWFEILKDVTLTVTLRPLRYSGSRSGSSPKLWSGTGDTYTNRDRVLLLSNTEHKNKYGTHHMIL